VTTTVCPVASASAISSSVIASVAQNPTYTPAPKTSDAAAQTGDKVLTYTLGTGTSQSVVTTTIKNTKTTTAYTVSRLPLQYFLTAAYNFLLWNDDLTTRRPST
jgi:hypothetical protein